MLVNIWSTIINIGDEFFTGAERHASPALDFLVCVELAKATKDRQTWMVKPVWSPPGTGTTGTLLRNSYDALIHSTESYLTLITPGFADVLHGVSADLVASQLTELCRRCRAFNKRTIVTLLGVPPEAPADAKAQIEQWNSVCESVVTAHQGLAVDLRGLAYEPWNGSFGSRPANIAIAAEKIAQGVMDSHCESNRWRALHAQ